MYLALVYKTISEIRTPLYSGHIDLSCLLCCYYCLFFSLLIIMSIIVISERFIVWTLNLQQPNNKFKHLSEMLQLVTENLTVRDYKLPH